MKAMWRDVLSSGSARVLLCAVLLGVAVDCIAQVAQPIPPPAVVGDEEPGDASDTTEHEETGPSASGPIEFQGDEIGLVLRTLARQARINLVISNNVRGTVTLRLADKTPREAIGVIVAVKGLFMDEQNGVFYVKTSEDLRGEPIDRQLARTAESTLPALAQFKGQYFRQLVESGLPQEVASKIVLEEQLSEASTGKVDSAHKSAGGEITNEWWEQLGSSAVQAVTGLALLSIFPGATLHIALAIALFVRARRIRKRGEPLAFFGPVLWSLAALIGGVFVAAFYWLVNESTLRTLPPPKAG